MGVVWVVFFGGVCGGVGSRYVGWGGGEEVCWHKFSFFFFSIYMRYPAYGAGAGFWDLLLIIWGVIWGWGCSGDICVGDF